MIPHTLGIAHREVNFYGSGNSSFLSGFHSSLENYVGHCLRNTTMDVFSVGHCMIQ